MDGNKIVAAVLILIPFIAYLALPLYNVQYPEALGLPFFYWYQIIWLPISGLLFYIAAVLIDKNHGKAGRRKK
ncbi:DUF3311 domain-containing protein [Candidatus Marsarchaeota archaeon]|nr:DUF3311 domain-containing protein [Candidatus Marsarchaeota archaeon]MCL5404811.1 DUF3311 domain-containing protein [Candidatus Marsarchaeota archaeon]